jgi:prepilin-type N-terminal cleavage/methylation domain-containing protein
MSKLQQRLEARRNENGFTLIEMLIVIVVLGILASIVVFGVAKFRDDAADAACAADLKTVSVAVDAYMAQQTGTPAVADLVSKKYLKAAPTNIGTVTVATDGTVTAPCA